LLKSHAASQFWASKDWAGTAERIGRLGASGQDWADSLDALKEQFERGYIGKCIASIIGLATAPALLEREVVYP
jgi:hypothetical protein